MNYNTMRYKGYIASVEYSEENGCFFGRVLGIDDIITFEGESVKELRSDFENAIKCYLETCAEIGKTPERQRTGKLLLRIPAELQHKLEVESGTTGESINNLVVEALQASYQSSSIRANDVKPGRGRKQRKIKEVVHA